MRSAFTLVEVLVALVIFAFGMLALAATSAVTARDFAAATLGVRAQSLARNRVELMRAAPCPAAAAGSAAAGRGVTEFWRVDADGARRLLSDSVVFSLPRGRRGHVVHRASLLCAS
jgi:prepilin-type N-terminal cleavage/methylation domain-containing protein